MKKLKYTVILLLSLCMFFSVISVGAVGDDNEEHLKAYNELAEMYRTGMGKFPPEGAPPSIYTKETLKTLLDTTDTAREYLAPASSASTEQLKQSAQDIQTAINGLQVRLEVLQYIYDYTGKEQNNGGYYPQELWDAFCSARSKALEALTAPDVNSIAENFFTLREKFNDLCKSNLQAGDLNHDGKVNISDVLFLQKYRAKMVSINSSQLFVAKYEQGGDIEEVTMQNVLGLQKYLARMIDPEQFYSWPLQTLVTLDQNALIDYKVYYIT